jgi:prefoldin subunit 5
MFLEQRLESLDQKLQTIESKLSSLDEKVTAILEMEASKPQNDNQSLRDVFESFKNNWTGDSAEMQNLRSQLERVKSSLGNLTENLVAASSDSNSTSVK